MPDQIDPDVRLRLLQEELDRRFAALEREVSLRIAAAKTIRRYLADEINRRFDDSRRENDLRFDSTIHMRVALQEEIDRRFTDLASQLDRRFMDSERAVQAALAAAEKAVIKAETAAERRFASVNEFRQTLTDQATTFMTRNEYLTAHQGLADKQDAADKRVTERIGALELRLTSRLDRGEGIDSGTRTSGTKAAVIRSQAIAILAVVVAITSVILLALKNKRGGRGGHQCG